MTLKHLLVAVLFAAAALLAVCIIEACRLGPGRYPNAAGMRTEEMCITQVWWNLPLARVELNFTVNSSPPQPFNLDHVEVNGIRVDFYPQTLSLEPGQSAIIKVYYNYDYDSKYEFSFITEEGTKFPSFFSQSPPE